MGFFTNKHVIVAFVVAPILAVVSYYAVDLIVKEKPHMAVSGASYPLIAQSNCRYTSGHCDLKNNDFLAQVTVEDRAEKAWLVVTSEQPIEQVNVGFARHESATTSAPGSMRQNTSTNAWEIEAPMSLDENTMMMIVLQSNNVKYYADTTMAFSRYETSFNKTF